MSKTGSVRRSDLDEYRLRLAPTDLLVERRLGKARSLLPQRVSAALKAFGSRRKFNQMLVLSEDMGFLLGGLLKLSRWKGKLHIVVHAGHGRRRKFLFGLTDSPRVANYIVFCERQRQVLINDVGFDPSRVRTLLNPIDTVFFDAQKVESRAGSGGHVFSCGLENRDYTTLSQAAEKTDIPFIVQATGYFNESKDPKQHPANFDVRKTRVSFERLRELYHESLFAVVPLNAVDYAAGVNGILEAMAMGKAVIAMQSPGLAEYLAVEGVRVVSPHDPKALVAVIEELRASPELCTEMGAKNRAWVVENCEVSNYADKVANLMS